MGELTSLTEKILLLTSPTIGLEKVHPFINGIKCYVRVDLAECAPTMGSRGN